MYPRLEPPRNSVRLRSSTRSRAMPRKTRRRRESGEERRRVGAVLVAVEREDRGGRLGAVERLEARADSAVQVGLQGLGHGEVGIDSAAERAPDDARGAEVGTGETAGRRGARIELGAELIGGARHSIARVPDVGFWLIRRMRLDWTSEVLPATKDSMQESRPRRNLRWVHATVAVPSMERSTSCSGALNETFMKCPESGRSCRPPRSASQSPSVPYREREWHRRENPGPAKNSVRVRSSLLASRGARFCPRSDARGSCSSCSSC
jgi:hypothetical protein